MEKETVRDRFWLFASRAHDDDVFLGKPDGRLSWWSRITPGEGAHMLGVSNMMMVASDGIPVPFSMDAYGYMESFCRMKRVLWSVTGSGAWRNGNEEEWICRLAEKYPNIRGAYLDDMFGWEGGTEEVYAAQLKEIRQRLDKCGRPMEIYATCYIKDVEKYSPALYDDIDVLTIWCMDDIPHIIDNFEKYEKLLPNKRKMLGIYFYDYKHKAPVSDEIMKLQCETGLRWLHEGRIEGMVFLTNCVMGLGLSSEYWLRDWIDQVGDQEL